MSSSRSIAAARARRAGETAQPQQSRPPVTSINSQAAFAQQSQYQASQRTQQSQSQSAKQMPQGRNVRVASAQMAPQAPTQMEQSRRAKLSISDAIGLITLRLGRVETILIEKEHELATNGGGDGQLAIPENSQIVDKSVLANIIARMDALEKNNRDFSQLTAEVKILKEALMNVSVKVDTYVKETNERFADYEVAISEIEAQLPMSQLNTTPIDDNDNDANVLGESLDTDVLNVTTEFDTPILSTDLKALIKNEFNENN